MPSSVSKSHARSMTQDVLLESGVFVSDLRNKRQEVRELILENEAAIRVLQHKGDDLGLIEAWCDKIVAEYEESHK